MQQRAYFYQKTNHHTYFSHIDIIIIIIILLKAKSVIFKIE